MKTFIYLLCSLWLSLAVHAAELKFEPATPIVEMNKSITLSVANTEGTVEWIAGKGKIQGEGNKVTYLAPDQVGSDLVAILDSKGNTGSIKVVITPPITFPLKMHSGKCLRIVGLMRCCSQTMARRCGWEQTGD